LPAFVFSLSSYSVESRHAHAPQGLCLFLEWRWSTATFLRFRGTLAERLTFPCPGYFFMNDAQPDRGTTRSVFPPILFLLISTPSDFNAELTLPPKAWLSLFPPILLCCFCFFSRSLTFLFPTPAFPHEFIPPIVVLRPQNRVQVSAFFLSPPLCPSIRVPKITAVLCSLFIFVFFYLSGMIPSSSTPS